MRSLLLTTALVTLAGLEPSCLSPTAPLAAVAEGAEDLASTQAPATWGTIKGQIVWGGSGWPEAKKVDINQDREHCQSRGDIFSEEWVVNKENKGVRWAVVWLEPDEPKGKMPIHPNLQAVPREEAVMDQPCCKFEPHVLAMQKGQVLEFKNSAPVAHNVRWAGIGNRGDNKTLPAKTSLKVDDLKASPYAVKVNCDFHKWMNAYIHVFNHPYFVITDANGRFEIKQAPAGNYRLAVWQEAIGWRDVEYKETNGDKVRILGTKITIKADGTTDVGKLDLKPAQP